MVGSRVARVDGHVVEGDIGPSILGDVDFYEGTKKQRTSSKRAGGVCSMFVWHFACELWSRERESYWRMLLNDWALSKNWGSTALAIGLSGLAKLNRSIENFYFLLSIALLGRTKSTIAWDNSAMF